jgi:hypothetical protein
MLEFKRVRIEPQFHVIHRKMGWRGEYSARRKHCRNASQRGAVQERSTIDAHGLPL